MKVSKEERNEEMKTMFTTEFKDDFHAHLKTRTPICYVTSRDEPMFLRFFDHFCAINGYEGKIWDPVDGLICVESQENDCSIPSDQDKDPITVLKHIMGQGKQFMNKRESVRDKRQQGINGVVYVIRNGADHFSDPLFVQYLNNIAYLNGIVTTIILGSTERYAPTLTPLMPYITAPNARPEAFLKAFDEITQGVEPMLPEFRVEMENKQDKLAEMFDGFTVYEAQFIVSHSIVTTRGIDFDIIQKKIDNSKKREQCQILV